jgi:hypothetical protein
MKYEEMPPIERDEAIAELESQDTARVSCALVRLALNDPDRAWLEDVLAAHLQSNDTWVRGVAATCAGHVARLHGALDTARMVPLIERLFADPTTMGQAEDALDDIEIYVGRTRP